MRRYRELTGVRVEEQLRGRGSRKILFGHQSVGADIVREIEALGPDSPGSALRLIESRDPGALSAPALCHFRIGRNTDPGSKIADFERVMLGGFGEKADIAFFKFCYVDIDAGSDVERIFRAYSEAMTRLRKSCRAVRFLHVTVPVVEERSYNLGVIRRFFGKGGIRKDDNAARGRFNQMLTQTYLGSEPVFDLATIEAGPFQLGPDGAPPVRRPAGPLAAGFTDDGCHLNAKGRRVVAEALLAFLSDLSAERAAAT